MKGLEGYTLPDPDGKGGVIIDTERMLVDLITIYKATGLSFTDLRNNAERIWADVQVGITIPKENKQ